MKEVSANAPAAQAPSKPHPLFGNDPIYDQNLLFDQICKLNNDNYSGNQSLLWGKVKLQLHTRNIEELRRKFNELNVTLRQIGVDEEKNFIDERILIGERLL